jgi:hypothetical protein
MLGARSSIGARLQCLRVQSFIGPVFWQHWRGPKHVQFLHRAHANTFPRFRLLQGHGKPSMKKGWCFLIGKNTKSNELWVEFLGWSCSSTSACDGVFRATLQHSAHWTTFLGEIPALSSHFFCLGGGLMLHSSTSRPLFPSSPTSSSSSSLGGLRWGSHGGAARPGARFFPLMHWIETQLWAQSV